MSTPARRLACLFTPEYATRINAQLVHPASSVVVKPHELRSALARPAAVAHYEPHRDAEYLAASFAFGLINGHPFMDGNKRTAFFLADQYLRAFRSPSAGFASSGSFIALADQYIGAASARQDVSGLAAAMGSRTCEDL